MPPTSVIQALWLEPSLKTVAITASERIGLAEEIPGRICAHDHHRRTILIVGIVEEPFSGGEYQGLEVFWCRRNRCRLIGDRVVS